MEDKPAKTKKQTGESPKKKRPGYHRQRNKVQRTVRIDENLEKAVMVRVQAENLRLTDAIESGLWLWIQRQQPTETIRQGRFLWNVISLDVQKLLMAVISLWHQTEYSTGEEIAMKAAEKYLLQFSESPKYIEGLDRAGTIPKPA